MSRLSRMSHPNPSRRFACENTTRTKKRCGVGILPAPATAKTAAKTAKTAIPRSICDRLKIGSVLSQTGRAATYLWQHTVIALLLGNSLLLPAAQAHKTQVSGDVAGIWHVEPNHSPKAGEPAQVWIALTQPGGKVIPLSACECRLTVYASRAVGDTPLLEPDLQAIAAEHYQGIPGATVIFPAVGQYVLQLIGAPKGDASFQPFALDYTVTVAAGQSLRPSSVTTPGGELTPHPQDAKPESTAVAGLPLASSPLRPRTGGGPLGGAIGLVGLASLVAFCWLRRRHHPPDS